MNRLTKNPSRREFLSGAAVTAVAVSRWNQPDNDAGRRRGRGKAADVKADETIETQVVVIGSGLGGFAAAMTAMEEGRQRR